MPTLDRRTSQALFTEDTHQLARSSISDAMTSACAELSQDWDRALTNAYNTGSQEENQMEVVSATQAAIFRESTGKLLEARSIPLWNTGEGKDVRAAQIPQHAKWGVRHDLHA